MKILGIMLIVAVYGLLFFATIKKHGLKFALINWLAAISMCGIIVLAYFFIK